MLQPAIELAEGGFPVSPVTATQWRGCFSQLTRAGGPGVGLLAMQLCHSKSQAVLGQRMLGKPQSVSLFAAACGRQTGLTASICALPHPGEGADDSRWQGAGDGAAALQPRPGGHLPPSRPRWRRKRCSSLCHGLDRRRSCDQSRRRRTLDQSRPRSHHLLAGKCKFPWRWQQDLTSELSSSWLGICMPRRLDHSGNGQSLAIASMLSTLSSSRCETYVKQHMQMSN